MSNNDVIAAIATAPGRGGIGVVRVSGKDLGPIMQGIIGAPLAARHATFSSFLGENGEILDEGIALYFPAPRSFTGEEVLELQGHGGGVVLQMVLERCLALGARLAEPGEFTRRAYLNDKIDLAQAESVADLIDASTTEAARSALRSLRGEFSTVIHDLVDRLIRLRTLVEATLDFPDEDIDFLSAAGAGDQLDEIDGRLSDVFRKARQGSLLREGLHIVLIGQPNVGKSSLLNQLTGEDVAIVTPIAGTTRDTIHQNIEIGGVAAHIIDTAGLRQTEDPVEQAGISRTWKAIESADIALLLVDASRGVAPEDMEILGRLPAALPVVRALNKIDLAGLEPKVLEDGDTVEIRLSAKTGAGVDLLRDHLKQRLGLQTGEGVFMARERHLRALREAGHHLGRARESWLQTELMAEELRLTQTALSTITGEFSADDLLGEIFSNFCIGK